MAFSNIRKVPVGGGLSFIYGDFTHTEGAAAQTLAMAGDVLFCVVTPNTTAEPVDFSGTVISKSLSGQITTATLYTESGISAGTVFMAVREGG